jgi:hypothetical protein
MYAQTKHFLPKLISIWCAMQNRFDCRGGLEVKLWLWSEAREILDF